MVIVFLTLLFSSFSYANNEAELDLIKISANSKVVEALPRNCRYVSTDMYTGAAASRMYLKGEEISLYNISNNLQVDTLKSRVENASSDKGSQMKAYEEHRKGLVEYIKVANTKLSFQKGALSGLGLAKAYALRTYSKQASLMNTCLDNLQSSSHTTNCSSCQSTVDKTMELIKKKREVEFSPLESIESEKQSLKVDKYLAENLKRDCGNFICGSNIKSAAIPCDAYRKMYWVHAVYCNPNTLKNDVAQINNNLQKNFFLDLFINQAFAQTYWDPEKGLTIKDPKLHSSYKKMKRYIIDFLDEWVAHPRGRAVVYHTMEEQTKTAIDVTTKILENAKHMLTQVENDMKKMSGKDMLEKLPDNPLEIPEDKNPCWLPKCISLEKVWGLRGRDFKTISPVHAVHAKSLTELSIGLNKKGKLTNAYLDKLKNLGNQAANLDNYNKRLEAEINRKNSLQGIGKLNLDGSKNNLNIKVNKGIAATIPDTKKLLAVNVPPSVKKENPIIKPDTTIKEKVNEARIVFEPEVEKKLNEQIQREVGDDSAELFQKLTNTIQGKDGSLFKIISSRYRKIYAKEISE